MALYSEPRSMTGSAAAQCADLERDTPVRRDVVDQAAYPRRNSEYKPQPCDGIPATMCLRCGLNAHHTSHASAETCIDALRDLIATVEHSGRETFGRRKKGSLVDTNDVITIIGRRRAKLEAQRRPGPQEGMDEAARLMVEEYDSLLAEIETAIANQPKAERQNKKAEAAILGDQGQSGG